AHSVCLKRYTRTSRGVYVTSSTRWKLACAFLAAVAGYAMFFSRGSAPNTPAASAIAPRGALPIQLRRPIRVAPESIGVSKQELVDRILGARALKEMLPLVDKVPAVGDDDAVDQLAPLLADPRHGVPEAMLSIFGQIGTEHAVGIVIAHTGDERPAVRNAAIMALGSTHSKPAEEVLVALAAKAGDPGQTVAISALGQLGSERALDVLAKLAGNGDEQVVPSALAAIGGIASPAADELLRKLVDSPDPRVAAAAVGAIDVVDEALLARLVRLAHSGDSNLQRAAISALGKAGEAALPVL